MSIFFVFFLHPNFVDEVCSVILSFIVVPFLPCFGQNTLPLEHKLEFLTHKEGEKEKEKLSSLSLACLELEKGQTNKRKERNASPEIE